MIGLLGAAYDWVKAAHIIFVVFWMACKELLLSRASVRLKSSLSSNR